MASVCYVVFCICRLVRWRKRRDGPLSSQRIADAANKRSCSKRREEADALGR